MKQYNKLPFKERKRHAEYRFNQTERQDKIQFEREMKKYEKEKLSACRELSDKERQEEEVMKRLKEIAERK